MTIGAITIKKSGSTSDAPTYKINLSIAGLGVYATSGVPMKAAVETALQRSIDIVEIRGRGGIYLIGEYDTDNDLLKLYDAGTGAEVANGVDTSAQTFQVIVAGK